MKKRVLVLWRGGLKRRWRNRERRYQALWIDRILSDSGERGNESKESEKVL